jgi:3-dehydroquinate dehydratase II
MKIIIINGPNLNLLGKREPEKYGNLTFDEFFPELQKDFPDIQFDFFQSNIEGELINKIHETGFSYDGIILNAGGYTHTSVSIADALKAITTPVVEVHITNIYSREEVRRNSLLASVCRGSISGFGLNSYRLAVESFVLR